MHKIELLLELQGPVRTPVYSLKLNDVEMTYEQSILASYGPLQRARAWFALSHLEDHNILKLIMRDKQDHDNRPGTDHMITVRQISIDGVDADFVLFHHTYFEHSMPAAWVEHMRSQGHQIESCYRPGTEIRLNGAMTFEFAREFWLQKTLLMAR